MLDSILKSVAFFGLTVFVSAVKLYLVLSVCDIVAVFKSSIVCQVFCFFLVCVYVCVTLAMKGLLCVSSNRLTEGDQDDDRCQQTTLCNCPVNKQPTDEIQYTTKQD